MMSACSSIFLMSGAFYLRCPGVSRITIKKRFLFSTDASCDVSCSTTSALPWPPLWLSSFPLSLSHQIYLNTLGIPSGNNSHKSFQLPLLFHNHLLSHLFLFLQKRDPINFEVPIFLSLFLQNMGPVKLLPNARKLRIKFRQFLPPQRRYNQLLHNLLL